MISETTEIPSEQCGQCSVEYVKSPKFGPCWHISLSCQRFQLSVTFGYAELNPLFPMKLPFGLVSAAIFTMVMSACMPPRPTDPIPLPSAEVFHVGEMRKVMWSGEVEATISIDSLVDRDSLYGVGPLEGLRGEITVFKGEAFVSRAVSDTAMSVEATWDAKAPFFVYARVSEWEEFTLPDSVGNLASLEHHLDALMREREEPFAFKLQGKVGTTVMHVVNLPPGTEVNSPDDAHQGQVDYPLVNVDAEVIGFFSRNHAGVFTHHDSYMHLHLVTEFRTMAGHVDVLTFEPGDMRLWVAK